jgi:hypothetical protein
VLTKPTLAEPLPESVSTYLEQVVALADSTGGACVSIILYGSAAVGGYQAVSDVDLMLVLADDASADTRERMERGLLEIEERLGMGGAEAKGRGRLHQAVNGRLGVFGSHFVCPRSAFLAGEAWRIFGVSARSHGLISRIIFANILCSATTVWGEDLRPLVRTANVTRVDLLKALWGVWSILIVAVMLALPRPRVATRYAMAALKKSVHNTYFCYALSPAPLALKVTFFTGRMRALVGLRRLLSLREHYQPSVAFVLSCLWTIPYLHYRAARDNRFPIQVRADA